MQHATLAHASDTSLVAATQVSYPVGFTRIEDDSSNWANSLRVSINEDYIPARRERYPRRIQRDELREMPQHARILEWFKHKDSAWLEARHGRPSFGSH